MLPLIPTLLLNPNPKTQDHLRELVNRISSSKEESDIKNYFLENYIHCNKYKTQKKRGKPNVKEKTSQSSEKKMEEQSPVSPEQIFLMKAIQQKESWQDIANKLYLESKMFGIKRNQWNYYSYLIFVFLEKLQGTLGYFIGIKLMNRTWATSELTFKSLQNSIFFKQKFQEVMKRDLKSIQKIEFTFLRDLILSIKLGENIEVTLKRMNYANCIELKTKHSIDPAWVAQDWVIFLCTKINNNKAHERPSIKYEKQNFVLKWVKVKIITPSMKQNFDHKLSFLLSHKEQLSEIVINEIELILLQGIREKKSWQKVQQEIQQLKNRMNQIGKQSHIKGSQNFSQSSRPSRKSSRKKKGKEFMQDSKQYISVSSGKTNSSQQLIQGDLQSAQSKKQPLKPKFFQDIPIKSSYSPKKKVNITGDIAFSPKKQAASPPMKALQKSLSQTIPKKQNQVDSDLYNIRQSKKTKQQMQLSLSGDQQLILFFSSRLIQSLQLIRKDCFPGVLERQLAEYYENYKDALKQKSNNILNLVLKNPQRLIEREHNLKTLLSMQLAAKDTQFIKRSIESERKKVSKTKTTYEIMAQLQISLAKQYKQLCQQLRRKQKSELWKQKVKNDD